MDLGGDQICPMIFTDSIIKDKPINIFNHGNMERDFTYIDDVTEILFRLISKPATADMNFNFESPSLHQAGVNIKFLT